jgi:hypothetical protein
MNRLPPGYRHSGGDHRNGGEDVKYRSVKRHDVPEAEPVRWMPERKWRSDRFIF